MILNLEPRLSQKNIQAMLTRFHFEDKDAPKLEALYLALLPLLEAKAYYAYDCLGDKISCAKYAGVIVTLGKGVDELADLYLEHEQLAEAYMIDCLGLELLSMCYEDILHQLENATMLYAEKLSFLGDEYPLEVLPELMLSTGACDLSVNDAFFIRPTKSASLIIPLTETKKADATAICNTCSTCNNYSCPSRKAPSKSMPLTYGNLQIFKK